MDSETHPQESTWTASHRPGTLLCRSVVHSILSNRRRGVKPVSADFDDAVEFAVWVDGDTLVGGVALPLAVDHVPILVSSRGQR